MTKENKTPNCGSMATSKYCWRFNSQCNGNSDCLQCMITVRYDFTGYFGKPATVYIRGFTTDEADVRFAQCYPGITPDNIVDWETPQ